MGVLEPQCGDVDGEQRRGVVVAHVLEVEPRARIVVDGPLPVRRRPGRQVGPDLVVQCAAVGRDGERQPFGHEPRFGPAEIVQGQEADTDAVVMAHAGPGLERQIASGRRRGDELQTGELRGHEVREHVVEQRRAPPVPGQAEHGRLLLDLLPAAEHGE